MSFADHSELEVFQGRATPFDPVKAAQADMLLELATAAIIAEAGQSIERSETTADLMGVWSRDLELPERPVVAVSLVKVNGVALGSTDWFWIPGSQKIRRGQPFGPYDVYDDDLEEDDAPRGATGATGLTWGGPDTVVTVVYEHGNDPIPNLARLVCLSAADRYLSNPTGIRQATLGPASFTYDGDGGGNIELTGAETRLIRRAFRRRARIG